MAERNMTTSSDEGEDISSGGETERQVEGNTASDAGSDEGSGGGSGGEGAAAANITEERIVSSEIHNRVIHNHYYHGPVYLGDVVWSKTDVKDSTIGNIGEPSHLPAQGSPFRALTGATSPQAVELGHEETVAAIGLAPTTQDIPSPLDSLGAGPAVHPHNLEEIGGEDIPGFQSAARGTGLQTEVDTYDAEAQTDSQLTGSGTLATDAVVVQRAMQRPVNDNEKKKTSKGTDAEATNRPNTYSTGSLENKKRFINQLYYDKHGHFVSLFCGDNETEFQKLEKDLEHKHGHISKPTLPRRIVAGPQEKIKISLRGRYARVSYRPEQQYKVDDEGCHTITSSDIVEHGYLEEYFTISPVPSDLTEKFLELEYTVRVENNETFKAPLRLEWPIVQRAQGQADSKADPAKSVGPSGHNISVNINSKHDSSKTTAAGCLADNGSTIKTTGNDCITRVTSQKGLTEKENNDKK